MAVRTSMVWAVRIRGKEAVHSLVDVSTMKRRQGLACSKVKIARARHPFDGGLGAHDDHSSPLTAKSTRCRHQNRLKWLLGEVREVLVDARVSLWTERHMTPLSYLPHSGGKPNNKTRKLAQWP
jgi:hypothetical protein